MGVALASHVLGLCRNYTAVDICYDEETQTSMSRVLAIGYIRAALTVTLSPFQAAQRGFEWTLERSWNLDADAVPPSKNTDRVEKCWGQFSSEIKEIPGSVSKERPITHVILMGESAFR